PSLANSRRYRPRAVNRQALAVRARDSLHRMNVLRIRINMKQDFRDFHASLAALDDHSINPSRQASLNEVVDRSRRGLLKGGLGLAGVAFLGGGLSASAAFAADSSLMGFESVPVQLDPAFDSVQVPPGYRARVFFSWGDPV